MLVEIVLLLVSVALALWAYGRWCHGYWARLGVKSPPSTFLIGHLHHVYSTTRAKWEWLDDAYYKHNGKEFCGVYNFLTPQLVVADPELLKNILVRDFDHFVDHRHLNVTGPEDQVYNDFLTNATGERWRRIRAAVTPAFTSGRLKTMFPLIMQKAGVLSKVAEGLAEDPQATDIQQLMGRFTMDAVASCGFGIECNSLENEDEDFPKRASVIFNPSIWRVLQLTCFYIAPRLCQALGFRVASPTIRYFTQVVTEILQHREATGDTRGDFIDLMIEARKNPDSDSTRSGRKRALEDATVVSQAIVFLLMGYGGLSYSLAFCSYHLARDQHLQDLARQEIMTLKEKHGGRLSYDAVMEAKFLDACITETLRLYPSESTLDRLCVKDYKLGEKGLKVPAGMIVEVPVWSIHHDPLYWPRPYEFLPQRHLQENKHEIVPYTYLPFGIGPRNCIGQRFTMLVTKTALAYLLSSVKLTTAPGFEEPPELAISPIILRPKNGVQIVVKSLTNGK